MLQKKEERRYLAVWQSIKEWPLPGATVLEDERPDFVLEKGDFKVGVEVRRMFKATEGRIPPRQATESAWEGVVQAARRTWEEEGKPCIEAAFLFSDQYHVTKRDESQLATKIVKLLDRYLPSPGDSIAFSPDDVGEDWAHFPDELDYFRVSRLIEYKRNYWSVMDGGWLGNLTPETVQSALDAKADLLPVYRERVADVWILLVLDGAALSSMVAVLDSVVEAIYASHFDRAFLLQAHQRQAFELRVQKGDGRS